MPSATVRRRRLAVVTSSRADYGFLKPILGEIRGRRSLALDLLVTGSHLEGEAPTLREIEADGFPVAGRFPLGAPAGSLAQMARAVGRCVEGFSAHFERESPDILVVIADRYEMFGAAVAGAACGLPVAHVSGGDLTEGVLDDSFRHALTKLAHLHFPSNELSARRILQMGEEPWRVLVVGEPSLDALAGARMLSEAELASRLELEPGRWEPPLIATLHPETLRAERAADQAANLIRALEGYEGWLIITAANHDAGGTLINEALRAFARRRPRTRFFGSLGWLAYASLMSRARAMIGNSSSGLLEAPSFALPVVNIGDRQRGRLRAANVIDAADEPAAIRAALERALAPGFRAALAGLVNPYWDGRSAIKIVDALERAELGGRLREKRFQEWPQP